MLTNILTIESNVYSSLITVNKSNNLFMKASLVTVLKLLTEKMSIKSKKASPMNIK